MQLKTTSGISSFGGPEVERPRGRLAFKRGAIPKGDFDRQTKRLVNHIYIKFVRETVLGLTLFKFTSTPTVEQLH